jgi:hypothetical protein
MLEVLLRLVTGQMAWRRHTAGMIILLARVVLACVASLSAEKHALHKASAEAILVDFSECKLRRVTSLVFCAARNQSISFSAAKFANIWVYAG